MLRVKKSHHIAVYEITGTQGLLTEKGRYAVGRGANVGCGERVLKRCVPEGGGLELIKAGCLINISINIACSKTTGRHICCGGPFISLNRNGDYCLGSATTLLPTPRLLYSHMRL